MVLKPTPPERALLFASAALLLLACLGPALVQPANYHHFADQRTLWGVPHALDVLSNLPFALLGLGGCLALRAWPSAQRTEQACSALFFGGLVATAAVSGLYHWQPDDVGLALDRLGMVLPFAGLLGLATAGRVSTRAGGWTVAAMLGSGALAVGVWVTSGNVLPWAVLQFGGMGLLLWLAARRPLPGALAVRWGAVITLYGVAKLLELADAEVLALSGGWVAGHSLKHMVASLSAAPVLLAICRSRGIGTIALQQSDGGVTHVG
ncbi:MAG: hypothetical protein KF686_07610 [Ramlibacter sp.]|nr:hypothetical protein [Ramlibacter sp.]